MPGAGRPGQVAVAGQRVQDQNRVAALLVERAPGFPGDADVRKMASAFQVEWADSDEFAVPGRISVAPCSGGRWFTEQFPAVGFGDEAERDAVFGGLPIHGLASIAGVGPARELVTSHTVDPAPQTLVPLSELVEGRFDKLSERGGSA